MFAGTVSTDVKEVHKALSGNVLGPESIESHISTLFTVCVLNVECLNPSKLVFHVSVTALFVYSCFLQDSCSYCDTENINKVNLESGEESITI